MTVTSEQRFGEFVVVRRHEGLEHVAELVLDRPRAMNAVSTDMARSIGAACAALGADPDVRVTVLTSSHERAFCVGADLKERNSFSDAELVRQRPTARAAYTGLDTSTNRSRRYCSDRCATRANVAAYRARKRQ
ncbi:enoyl-CoA hydratase/isomerase family protein, partial [Streptomyces clavifer]